MIYKVSYVVQGGEHPGSIRNEAKRPEIGDRVQIGPHTFQVIQVYEMMPARDGFQFLHAVVTTPDQAEAPSKDPENFW